MHIPLTAFEQYIDETILKRGYSYFKKGLVSKCDEISPHQYEAIVEGSEDYTVNLTVKKGAVTEHVCDCPYDMGPVCKHVAAVIFHIQRETLAIDITKKQTTKKAKPRKKSAKKQIKELLEQIPHEDLKHFIIEKASKNSSIKNLFLAAFAHYRTDESKEFYESQVRSILKSASDRHGFIDWSAIRRVEKEVFELLASAEKQLEAGNHKSVVFIVTAVMEQMTEALDYVDDSNGSIGGAVYEGYDILEKLINSNLQEDTRKMVFEYCISAFEKNTYAGWDWHTDVMEIASEIADGDQEVQLILSMIDKPQRSDYDEECFQNMKYDLLKRVRSENEAEEYLQKHIGNSKLRHKALEQAIIKKEFNRAIKIAKDGIAHDSKSKPGLAIDWYNWLLKIAQEQNDKEKIIEYARYLFMDNFRHQQDYYQILKEQVSHQHWSAFVNQMIEDIKNKNGKNGWYNRDQIAGIYIKEKWWARLWEFVKESPNLETVKQYEPHLSKDYAPEIIAIYGKGVSLYMKEAVGRSHYQNACRYLRRMIKLGGKNEADKVILQLRKLYPRRKALMEELNNV